MGPPQKTRRKHKKSQMYSSTSEATRHTSDPNNFDQCRVEIYRAPPRIMRTKLLCSLKFKSVLSKVTNELHSLCSQGREAEQDLFLQGEYHSYTHSGEGDIAFAILALRNIHFVKQPGYKRVLDTFKNQLKMLESSDMIQNKPFISASFHQKIARVFLRMDQPGSAFEWLHRAQMELQHAERCESTGDLLQSMGSTTTSQYFAQISSPKAAEIRRGAYHYYRNSYDHFSQENNSCTNLKLIQMLMCMFNALINIYLFKDKNYDTFFQSSVPTDDLKTSEKILNEIRERFIALDHQEHCYEVLMEILVDQATLMMRKTQHLLYLKDQLYSVSSLILQAQSDFDTFNQMTEGKTYTSDIKVSGSTTSGNKDYNSHTVAAIDFKSQAIGDSEHNSQTNDTYGLPAIDIHIPKSHIMDTDTSMSHTVETDTSRSHTVDTYSSGLHVRSHIKNIDSSRSQTMETDSYRSYTVKTNSSESHTKETDSSRSQTVKTDSSESHTKETDSSRSNTVKTDTSTSQTIATDISRSHTVKTDTFMPQTVKTDTLRSQTVETDSLNSQQVKANDSSSHTVETNESSFQTLKTNDSRSHTVETNDSGSQTVKTNDSSSQSVDNYDSECSHTVERNDFGSHRTGSNDSNSHMIQQCHMVYYQLHVCIASFIDHLITPHSTEDLQEALDHLQICPILQNILLDAIKYRSDVNVVSTEKERFKTEAESSPTENNLSSISDLSSGPENIALTEPE